MQGSNLHITSCEKQHLASPPGLQDVFGVAILLLLVQTLLLVCDIYQYTATFLQLHQLLECLQQP